MEVPVPRLLSLSNTCTHPVTYLLVFKNTLEGFGVSASFLCLSQRSPMRSIPSRHHLRCRGRLSSCWLSGQLGDYSGPKCLQLPLFYPCGKNTRLDPSKDKPWQQKEPEANLHCEATVVPQVQCNQLQKQSKWLIYVLVSRNRALNCNKDRPQGSSSAHLFLCFAL